MHGEGFFILKIMELKRFEKESIAFDFENEMVNTTDMMKNYPNKNMGNFLRNETTKNFINELEILIMRKSIIKKTGRYGGTMMHKLLAYKFAAWLSPKFELFVYKVFDSELRQQIEKAKQAKRKAEIREGYAWNALDRKDLYI